MRLAVKARACVAPQRDASTITGERSMKFAHTMHAAALGLLTAFSIQVAAQSVDTRPADEPRRTAGQTTEDAAITAKVKSALISDDLVKARRIDVDTKWGVVSLSGSVGSDAEREQAMK